LGIATPSFPWPGRQANREIDYLSAFPCKKGQPKENEADAKEMKGGGYRKNRMDAD
jgi:hypothetical protein